MAKLEDHHKLAIVEYLADFRGYAEITRLMKEEWEIQIDRAQVRSYDPSKPAYAGGDKWREIFDARRKAYLGSFEHLPIASDGFRLREMEKFYFRARDMGNIALSMKILMEAGELTSKINAKIPPNMIPRPAYMDLTPEERRAKVAEIFREAAAHDGVLDENGRIRVPATN